MKQRGGRIISFNYAFIYLFLFDLLTKRCVSLQANKRIRFFTKPTHLLQKHIFYYST